MSTRRFGTVCALLVAALLMGILSGCAVVGIATSPLSVGTLMFAQHPPVIVFPGIGVPENCWPSGGARGAAGFTCWLHWHDGPPSEIYVRWTPESWDSDGAFSPVTPSRWHWRLP